MLETPATPPFKGFISNVDTLSAVPAAKSGPNSLRPGPLRVDLVPGNVSEHIPVEHNDLLPSHTSLISDTLGSEDVSARSASESKIHDQSPEQSRDQPSVQETPGPTENAPSEADDPKRQVFPTSVNVADEPQKSVRKLVLCGFNFLPPTYINFFSDPLLRAWPQSTKMPELTLPLHLWVRHLQTLAQGSNPQHLRGFSRVDGSPLRPEF